MIRLIFTTSDDLFSLGIRAFTLSELAHVAIGLGPAGDQLLHVRTKKGVVLEPRKKWRQRTAAEFLVLRDVRPGLTRCMAEIGKPYDMGEVGARPILALLRTIMPLTPHDNVSPGAWSCARFVMLLDPTGAVLTEWQGLDHATATPADLFERCVHGVNFARVA